MANTEKEKKHCQFCGDYDCPIPVPFKDGAFFTKDFIDAHKEDSLHLRKVRAIECGSSRLDEIEKRLLILESLIRIVGGD